MKNVDVKNVILLVPMVVLALASPNAEAKALLKNAVQLPKLLQAGTIRTTKRVENPPGAPTNDRTTNPLPPVTSLITTPFSDDQVNECLTSMCGTAHVNVSNNDGIRARIPETLEFTSLWTNRVGPKVQAALTLDVSKTIQSLDRLEQLLATGQKAPVDTAVQAYMSFAMLAKKDLTGQLMQFISLDKTGTKIVVNDGAFNSYIATIPDPAERKAVQLIFDRLYRPALLAKSLGSSGNALIDRLMRKYSPISNLTDVLKIDGAALVASMANIRAQAGMYLAGEFADQNELSLFAKAAQGIDLSSAESDVYVTAADRIEMAEPIVVAGELRSALNAVGVDLELQLSIIRAQGLVARKRAAVLQKTSIGSVISAMQCRTLLGVALSEKNSGLSVRKYNQIIDEVKSAAKIVNSRLMTPENATFAAAIVDNVKFELQADPASALTTLEDGIAKEAAKTRVVVDALANGSKDVDDMLLVMASLLVADDKPDDLDPITTLCRAIPVDGLSDHTLTAQGRISLSWFTVTYRDIGMGVAGHELGHWVSANMRMMGLALKGAPNYLASLNCVANRNPFVLAPRVLDYYDNTIWSEEDWADHYSALVLNEMAKSPTSWARFSKNTGCALVSDDGDIYSGNHMESAVGDSHSSGFYRVLMIGLDRGQLTPSCQKFVTYAPANGRNLRCN